MTFDELVKKIKEYESNILFAEGMYLTHDEAVKLAEMCISKFIEPCLNECLVYEFLHEIRP